MPETDLINLISGPKANSPVKYSPDKYSPDKYSPDKYSPEEQSMGNSPRKSRQKTGKRRDGDKYYNIFLNSYTLLFSFVSKYFSTTIFMRENVRLIIHVPKN